MRLALAFLLAGCTVAAESNETTKSAVVPYARDWRAHPAVVDLAAPADFYAVSDVHGEIDLFRALLRNNGLIDARDAWTGGDARLVVAGDLIDKGPHSLEVIDLVRSLEPHVLTTLGNHEAEFLVDPFNSKATSTGQDKEGIDGELERDAIDPASLADGADAAGRGAWLRTLPFAARVGRWFFAHAGSAATLPFDALGSSLASSVDARGFAALTTSDSILEAQDWYTTGTPQASALAVDHIVFGHDPKALGDRGHICTSSNGVLVKIDTAMGIHSGSSVGPALMLHVHGDAVEVRDGSGAATPLQTCH